MKFDQTLQLYHPHEGQLQGHRSQKRFNIHCWGRQSGKTTYGLNKSTDKAWTGRRDGIYWYVLQTYDAAHVAFKRLYKLYQASPRAFDRKPNESDLLCRFRHGPEVTFKSGRNFEDLRIETLDGVVIDEYRQQSPLLWPVVIRPMLAHRQGWADILSTPNGFEHFFDLFESAKSDVNEAIAENRESEWAFFHHPSTIAPWWTPEEIKSARRTMSAAEFAQEIMAEFRDFRQGRVYVNYDAQVHERAQNPFARPGEDYSPYIPIIVGMDFNLSPMCWALGQNKVHEWYWRDEIYLENSHTQEAAEVLVSRVKNHKPGVVLVGDASGKARQRAAAANSDYDIVCQALTKAKIPWSNRTPESNPLVKDRTNAVNRLLCTADGTVSWWHHPDTKMLKKDMQRTLWKENQVVFDKSDPLLTHMSDAIGYPACALTPVPSMHKVGGLSVIIR